MISNSILISSKSCAMSSFILPSCAKKSFSCFFIRFLQASSAWKMSNGCANEFQVSLNSVSVRRYWYFSRSVILSITFFIILLMLSICWSRFLMKFETSVNSSMSRNSSLFIIPKIRLTSSSIDALDSSILRFTDLKTIFMSSFVWETNCFLRDATLNLKIPTSRSLSKKSFSMCSIAF